MGGRELPRAGARGGSPAGNAFWHILKATERSFCTLNSSNSVSCHILGQGR